MNDVERRFGVLGPLTFERDGVPVSVPGGHQRSLLALLLMAGGVPLTRDRLIDELWGESPPASAVSALHVHLSKLRDLLGDLVVRDPAGYSLTAGAFELDSWEFDALVEQARADPDEAAQLLARALDLVRGEPLCDVPCEGSIAQWRRALEEKHLQALLLRIDGDLEAGKSRELLAELELLSSEHPFEERICGQLMLALYRAGRQADALDTYARVRRAFSSELGLEPGEQLSQLQTRILERDPTLLASTGPDGLEGGGGLPGAIKPVAEVRRARPRSNLPRPVAQLVARESELAVLQGLMLDPHTRLVTLIGPGGVGKTRLALELAGRVEPSFPDGAVFVRLERLSDPAMVAGEIAAAIGDRDGDEGPGADGLEGHLRTRDLLMVVDNFEHLLPAAGVIADLLERAPSLRVVATSRAPLRIRGERWFAVLPLELPLGSDAGRIAESPAVQLFLQTAESAGGRLESTPEQLVIVAEICVALDGLPLAIELAASRCRVLTLEQIHNQLPMPLSIGERALRDLPDRQQTLRATIGWSYDLLTPGAQRALRAAGAFVGGFTVPALDAVLDAAGTGSVVADLEELLDASLVVSRGDGRFALLELIRAFARDALTASGELADVRRRLRRYLAEIATTVVADDDDLGQGIPEIASRLRPYHADLRAAVRDAVESGDDATAARLAVGMRPLWIAGTMYREAEELAGLLFERCEISVKDELKLLRALGGLEIGSSRWAKRFGERAEEVGDIDALVVATIQQFNEAAGTDLETMERLYPTLLTLLEHPLKPLMRAYVLSSQYGYEYVHGRFGSARALAREAQVAAVEIGYDYLELCARSATLLASSAETGEIPRAEVAALLAGVHGYGAHSLLASTVLFVARFAVSFDADAAIRLLTQYESIATRLGAGRSLEDGMRIEAMEILGLSSLEELVAASDLADPETVLIEAEAWLANCGHESAPRERAHVGVVPAH